MKSPASLSLSALIYITLGIGLVNCKGSEEVAPGPQVGTPIVTEKGTPTGDDATTATIGANGGSLSTIDGVFTLTVPAGALAANTSISAQPITNTAPGGRGTAYRLSPEGLTFQKPVTLTFKYTDEDFDRSNPQLGWIVTQNTDGSWNGYRTTKLDSMNKILQVESTHFSDWGVGSVTEIELVSNYNTKGPITIQPNEEVMLRVKGYDITNSDEAYRDALLIQLLDGNKEDIISIDGASWSVSPASVGKLRPDGRFAYYTAPSDAPHKVTVKVLVTGKDLKGKSRSVPLFANITIMKTGILLNVDNEQIFYKASTLTEDNLTNGTIVGNAFIMVGQSKESKSYFDLTVSAPKPGRNTFLFDYKKNKMTYLPDKNTPSFSLIPIENTCTKPGDCSKCTQKNNPFSYEVTFTTFPKRRPYDISKPPEIIAGTFDGTLSKDLGTTAECKSTIPVLLKGNFTFLYYGDK
jgi:hypothetical protein